MIFGHFVYVISLQNTINSSDYQHFTQDLTHVGKNKKTPWEKKIMFVTTKLISNQEILWHFIYPNRALRHLSETGKDKYGKLRGFTLYSTSAKQIMRIFCVLIYFIYLCKVFRKKLLSTLPLGKIHVQQQHIKNKTDNHIHQKYAHRIQINLYEGP